MGALFELLAELIMIMAAAALAHFGAVGDHRNADGRPPAVERTVLQAGSAVARGAVADKDCPEAARLRSV